MGEKREITLPGALAEMRGIEFHLRDRVAAGDAGESLQQAGDMVRVPVIFRAGNGKLGTEHGVLLQPQRWS